MSAEGFTSVPLPDVMRWALDKCRASIAATESILESSERSREHPRTSSPWRRRLWELRTMERAIVDWLEVVA